MKRLIFIALLLPVCAGAQNVGIGTTTPLAKLDVKSESSQTAIFNGPGSMYMSIYEADQYRGYWGSFAGAPEDVDFGTGSGTNGKLHLTIQAAPRLTIDASGNTGIGTQTPGYQLDVANRMRLRQGALGNIFTTPGIWHNDYRDGTERIFTGMQDSLRWGIFGGGSGAGFGWGFNFNSRTGNVNIGNTTADFYKLQVSSSDYGIGLYNATNSFYGNINSSSGHLDIESAYGSTFAGTPAKHILLNPPGTLFFFPGNVGVNTSTPNARFHVGGNVYIGTSTGTPAAGYQLSVQGKVMAEEVRVQLNGAWPDYVFADNYPLMPLAELEQQVLKNKHLPNIPPAAKVEQEGFDVGNMNKRLLEKVEELTLYLIELNKKNSRLEEKIQQLEQVIKNK